MPIGVLKCFGGAVANVEAADQKIALLAHQCIVVLTSQRGKELFIT